VRRCCRLGRWCLSSLIVAVWTITGSVSAWADEIDGSGLAGRLHDDGVRVSANRVHPGLNRAARSRSSSALKTRRPSGGVARVQRTAVPACPGNNPNRPVALDGACRLALTACVAMQRGTQPLQWIWERRIGPRGDVLSPWVLVGEACQMPPITMTGPLVVRAILTRAMIQRAFREVDFAQPSVRIQPVGNQTLVNFETFYRVAWPRAGVAPQEVATVTLLGRSVRIRPSVRSFTYYFGDGSSLGPTSDAGGTYPTGGVRHTYSSAGSVPVVVRALYTGDFSVDGGAWEPVDESVTITGPPTGLRVREATNRLEAGTDQ
jgi:hypothetical protein